MRNGESNAAVDQPPKTEPKRQNAKKQRCEVLSPINMAWKRSLRPRLSLPIELVARLYSDLLEVFILVEQVCQFDPEVETSIFV